jgi:hypothetical protein
MNFIHAMTTLAAWWMTALGSPRRSQSDRLRSRLLHEFRSAARAAAGGLALPETRFASANRMATLLTTYTT